MTGKYIRGKESRPRRDRMIEFTVKNKGKCSITTNKTESTKCHEFIKLEPREMIKTNTFKIAVY